jgi:hypothetical protein
MSSITKDVAIDGKTVHQNKLIKEYYDKIQPDMPFTDFQEICRTPFKHMKSKLRSGDLYEIRLKYFGKFKPRPKRLVWLLYNTQKRYDNGLIDQKTYNRIIIMITRYISNNAKDFKHKKDSLKRWIKI